MRQRKGPSHGHSLGDRSAGGEVGLMFEKDRTEPYI